MREEAIIRTLWLSFQYIKDMKVNKTRFCPSPTGLLHLGNLRTSLFSALIAKKDNGSFLLRIEDTDFAKETANLAKNSVLNQSAMAMVAQANQAQSAILAVLQ